MFIFLQESSFAQNEDYSEKLKLIELARSYWTDSLKFDLPEKFYSNTADIDTGMLYYVYVSRKDSIVAPKDFGNFKFCISFNQADSINKIKQVEGFDSFIYKTAGNADGRINKILLEYDDESMVFIIFHEATHYLLNKNYPQIPYSFTEAICDHNANCLLLNFFKAYPELNYDAALFQKKRIEMIYESINENYSEFLQEGKFSKSSLFYLTELIGNDKMNNQFLQTRFNYPVNNAYFLRNNFYSNNYFILNSFFENKTTAEIKQSLLKLFNPDQIAHLQSISNIFFKKK